MKNYLLAIMAIVAVASCSPKTTPANTNTASTAPAPAKTNVPPALNPAALYGAYCSGCHGGTGIEGASQGKAPRLDQPMGKDQIISIINNGVGSMPRFVEKLSPQEVDAIANFVVALKPAK